MREITKTEMKNRKKKKQATIITLGKSSSFDYLSTDKPLVANNMAERGEGSRPPRRTIGDYAYQQGPKHYNSIVIPPFSNKVVELKPALLSLIGSHPFVGMDHEDPYTHLYTFMELCSKAKTWLQSHPNKSLNTWEEDLSVQNLPSELSPKDLTNLSVRRGRDSKLCCEGAQIITLMMLHNYISSTVMILDASTGGTMMSKSPEEAIVIIDSIAASDYQSHHDRTLTQRKGIMELDTLSEILAQNKLLTQQIEVSIANKKNTDASIKNLEVQVGQLAKELSKHGSGSFSATTQVNPKEHCNLIITRWGIMVGFKDNTGKKNKEGSEEENNKNDEVINIPFSEALEQMATYEKFMKEFLMKKKTIMNEISLHGLGTGLFFRKRVKTWQILLIISLEETELLNLDQASFMMMNQVDSSSFDDDKKPKRMISRLSQQVQDQV
ncbi:hypothetical protein HKD37_12G034152 [Glycine soja]